MLPARRLTPCFHARTHARDHGYRRYSKKYNQVRLIIQQQGSAAALQAARHAAQHKSANLTDATSRGIKACIYDWEANPQEVVLEPLVDVPYRDWTVVDAPVNSKVKAPRRARGMAQAAAADDEGGEGEDGKGAGSTVDKRLPYRFVRLDPGQEWLAAAWTYQDEDSWEAQLSLSKDVVAQSQAIEGLIRRYRAEKDRNPGLATGEPIVPMLLAVVENPQLYCRVRIEALHALARLPPTTLDERWQSECWGWLVEARGLVVIGGRVRLISCLCLTIFSLTSCHISYRLSFAPPSPAACSRAQAA